MIRISQQLLNDLRKNLSRTPLAERQAQYGSLEDIPEGVPIDRATLLQLMGSRRTGSYAQPASGLPASSNYGTPINPGSLPLQGTITQKFGVPQAVKAAGEKIHAGVDIAVPVGQDLKDQYSGKVLEAREVRGYGNTVVVQGDDGIVRRYSHLSSLNVRPGDTVAGGQALGRTGNTGASTGPHLDIRWYKPQGGR